MISKKDIRKKFKDSVFERDKYFCRCCDKKYNENIADMFLDAHHIV